jgi:hypothetical protein
MVDVIGKYIYMYQCAKDASELSVFGHVMQPSSSSKLKDLVIGTSLRYTGCLACKGFARALARNTNITLFEMSEINILQAGHMAFSCVLLYKTNSVASI